MRMINITVIECTKENCHHYKGIACYLHHVFERYPMFQECDVMLVERQPPLGLIAVQEILRYEYGEKVKMMLPTKIHEWFHFRDYPKDATKEERYELRKVWSVELAQKVLREYCQQELVDTVTGPNERVHDIADAFIQLWYHMNMINNSQIRKRSKYFR